MEVRLKIKRISDPKLLAKVRENRCAVCGVRGVDPAHIKSKGSGGNDVPDNLLGFCRRHHSEQHSLGWSKFVELYPRVGKLLLDKGWEIRDVLGRKKLRIE